MHSFIAVRLIALVPFLLVALGCSKSNFGAGGSTTKKPAPAKVEPNGKEGGGLEADSDADKDKSGDATGVDGSGAADGGQVDGGGDAGGSAGQPKVVDSVVKVCEDPSKLNQQDISLAFAATRGQGCQVRQTIQFSRMSAYSIQKQTLNLPKRAVVCEINLEASNDTFFYDDEVFMNLDGFFLAGANHTEDVLKSFGMEQVGTLIKWDWEKHYGTKRDQDTGGCSGEVTCQFPRTQQEGKVKVNVPVKWLDRLPKANIQKETFEVSVVVAGNQNSSDDCGHTGLNFTGFVKYVE